LYLPSVGLALAAGAWFEGLAPRRFAAVLAVLVATGGVRAATRVSVWRDQLTVVLSILEDSPRSFDGPTRMVDIYLMSHQPQKALQAFDAAQRIYRGNPWLYASGADAAFALGRPPLADSMLARLTFLCAHCAYYLRYEAVMARARGDSAVAESLLSRLPAITAQ
jgi:predicted Zn-dependent protease